MSTSVDIPPGLEDAMEEELERGIYNSKSELIRDAIRTLLRQEGVLTETQLSDEAREAIKKARATEKRHPHSDVKEQLDD